MADAAKFKSVKYETAYYVQSKPWGTSSGDLKVYSPKLMPLIPMGYPPKCIPCPLPKSIFANSSECSISPNSITTQNYITAKAGAGFENPNFDYGAEIIIEPFDNDILNCRLTANVDNSVTRP